MNLTSPLNRIRAGMVALAVNTRAYFVGGFMLRNLLTNAILTVSGVINTLARLNDSTPAGPVSGYTIITAAGTSLFNNATSIATGLSGNPVSMVPFRPNAAVPPYLYIGDVAPSPAALEVANNCVTISTTDLYSGDPTTFACNRMVKVSSSGIIYKMGVKEPQLAPEVSTDNTGVNVSGNLLATAIPWTNFDGANPDFNYGESNGYPKPSPDGTIWFSIDVLNATTVTVTSLTGTATINGGSATPTTLGPSTGVSTNPGHYIQVSGTGGTPATATVVTGAFIDASGNVMPIGVAPLYIPSVVDVGGSIGTPITVPYGAVTFQIGINSTGNTYSANSGSFAFAATVTTDALSPIVNTVGTLSLYFWGDSPTSGPTGTYIWRNPGDPGGGTNRTISNALGNNAGNSFIFDATFTAGIPSLPGTGNGTTPMLWYQLNPNQSVSGTITVSPNQAANFNFCLYGNIYIPAPGDYTFVLTNHDDVIWGIEGCTLISAIASGSGEGGISLSDIGQTLTVVNGYPLLPRQTYTSASDNVYARTTVVANFAAAGVYGIELDGDYWYRLGRIFLLMASPTPGASPAIIPPGSPNQRQEVQYRYVYRSSATGAESNPSPESAAITLPVLANTITSLWSNDPQIDLVDYYRLDSTTSSFTYVATGPNDDLGGGGTNTPITDSLTDTDLGTQLLSYDNFEPFPSIDLPQKGTCTVSGGVITWVSGGSIGGSETGFNTRWLAGTTIVIGSPTGLAYILIARPTSTTSMTIPGVPDAGTPVQYVISEPILAAQALPYLWGPSDNIPFTCGCGDPLRPGTMYWCQGNNLDAAPDTNSQDLTSPDEALVNGIYSGGKGIVFTILRAIAVVPNFYNAEATATGTQGSTWSVETTGITRGLFMPRCLAVDGGGTIFFRVNDGIHASPGGGSSESITDSSLYPIFPHENSTPKPITRNGTTIYPPDDTQPQYQKFFIIDAYLYYVYRDVTNTQRQMVFDLAAKGWIWDTPTPAITAFASNESISVQGVLAGCVDGSIRQFSNTTSATETATATVTSGAMGGQGWGHTRLITVEYLSNAPITLSFVCPDTSTNGSIAPATIVLPSTGGTVTKWKTLPTFNKFKLLQAIFTHNDPTAQIYLDGFALEHKDWGSSGGYVPVNPFDGNSGGFGGQP
jgi:hypothetical protein